MFAEVQPAFVATRRDTAQDRAELRAELRRCGARFVRFDVRAGGAVAALGFDREAPDSESLHD